MLIQSWLELQDNENGGKALCTSAEPAKHWSFMILQRNQESFISSELLHSSSKQEFMMHKSEHFYEKGIHKKKYHEVSLQLESSTIEKVN